MSEPVIQVRHLGKQYRIGGARKRYKTIRESFSHAVTAPFRRANGENGDRTFWALKDINFEVPAGDVTGIIGRNGAGKSTLLKVLSRITDPSEGEVEIVGRVGSLLEVGTGFHPELTGRENIYLNGAILGMTRGEITKKFDEIVAFAETEKFLDTPVKFYSSGMYTRLAFSVAAHLEPEILVVDEVLAVGDAEFQKKCLGKMNDVAKAGRTVLFVSHNMPAVEQLCTSIVWLKSGKIQEQGSDVRGVIGRYMSGGETGESSSQWIAPAPSDHNVFRAQSFKLVDSRGALLPSPVRNDQDIYVTIEGEVMQEDPALQLGYAIYAEDGACLYYCLSTDCQPDRWPRLQRGRATVRSQIPRRFLNEGEYRLELMVLIHFREWIMRPGVNSPSIALSIEGGLSDSPYYRERRPTSLAPNFEWQLLPGSPTD